MTYLKKLAEEIIRRYEGGDPSNDRDIDSREVYELIAKVINKLFKMEYLNVHLPQNENVPPQASLAEFRDVPVRPYQDSTFSYTETKFDDIGFASDYWITPDGSGWFTDLNNNSEVDSEDNVWAISGQTVTLTVTEVAFNLYTILVSGISFPASKTAADLSLFFSNISETAYLEIRGFGEGTPNKFIGAGLSQFTATANSFGFTYNVTLANANAVYADLKNQARDTHSLLAYYGTETFTDTILNLYDYEYSVLDASGKSLVTLPIQPINLPRGMGVWRVYNPALPFVSYIPLSAGQYDIYAGVSHTGQASALGFLTAYEYFDNKTLIFNKSQAAMPATVNIQMVVASIKDAAGNYDEFGLLQLPADMEQQVVVEVLEMLSMTRPEDLVTDQNEAR